MDNSREPLTRTRLYNNRRRSFMLILSSFSTSSLRSIYIYQYYKSSIHIIYTHLLRASFDTRRRQTIAAVSITIIYYYITTLLQVYIIIILLSLLI